MSSLVRRIEKRRLKSMGFSRNKAGAIEDGDGAFVGSRWPLNFAFPILNKKIKRWRDGRRRREQDA